MKKHLWLLWLSLGFGAGILAAHTYPKAQASTPPPPTEAVWSALDRLTETYAWIMTDYVDDVAPDALMNGAVQGLLKPLDPHSAVLSPQDVLRFQQTNTGEFGGVGMQVAVRQGRLTVIAPLPDTPADRAGVQPGDLIMRVNGRPTEGWGLKQTIDVLRGPPDSVVTLRIQRLDQAPFTVRLVRAVVAVDPVVGRRLPSDLGLIELRVFQANTAERFDTVLDSLHEKGPLKGLILDLRRNPGGLVSQAVAVAERFLDGGLVVETRGRIGGRQWTASSGQDIEIPVVVLVDGGTASAAEILAGALQDRGRAPLLGQRTFGKGSVQVLRELSQGWRLKLTIARYYTPAGRALQAVGLTPDVMLESTEPAPIREADLRNALDNPVPTRDNQEHAKSVVHQAGADPWIAAAVAELKGKQP